MVASRLSTSPAGPHTTAAPAATSGVAETCSVACSTVRVVACGRPSAGMYSLAPASSALSAAVTSSVVSCAAAASTDATYREPSRLKALHEHSTETARTTTHRKALRIGLLHRINGV